MNPRPALSCAAFVLMAAALALQVGCCPDLFPFWSTVAGASDTSGDPNDPNAGADPNEPSDANAPLASIEGTWEVLPNDDQTSTWDDPAAPLATYLMGQGNPFASFGMAPEGRRSFVVFDAAATMTDSYQYDPNSDTLYIEVIQNPFLGRTMDPDPNGLYRFGETVVFDGPMGNGISARMVTSVAARPQDETGRTWTISMSTVVTATADDDLPPDPGVGTDAVAAGEQAVYRVEWSECLTPTDSMHALFPNTTWEILPDEREAGSALPTGYVELTGPAGRQAAWADPSSALAQLIAEQDASPIPEGPVLVQPAHRAFVHYDVLGAIGLTFDYDAATNRLEVSMDHPSLGQAPVRHEDGWTWSGTMTFGSDALSFALVTQIALLDGDPAARFVRFQETITVTANEDIPANGETGRGAIASGTTTSWSCLEYYVASPSESPWVLFPTAEILMGSDESGDD